MCLLSRVKRESSSEEQAELKVEIVWEREVGLRPSLVASSSIVVADSGSLSVVSKTQPGRNWVGYGVSTCGGWQGKKVSGRDDYRSKHAFENGYDRIHGNRLTCLKDAVTYTFHDSAVCYEESGLIMVTPGFQGDHFKGLEKTAFTFVVKAIAILVDDLGMLARSDGNGLADTDYAIVVSPYHSVGFGGTSIHKLTVHAVKGTGCACTDFQGHIETISGVVLQAGCDQR